MTSAFSCGNKKIWGSNGQIEVILDFLIKVLPENSLLLPAIIESRRGFYSGFVVDISDEMQGDLEKTTWKVSIAKALDLIKNTGGWSEVGNAWIVKNYENFQTLVD